MNASPASGRQRRALVVAVLLVAAVVSGWLWLRNHEDGGFGDLVGASAGELAAAEVDAAGHQSAAAVDQPVPGVLQRAVRTAQTHQSQLPPVVYEQTLMRQELARLEELARTGKGVVRAAAETVIEMHRARFDARAAFLGESPNPSSASMPDQSGPEGLGVPPAALLEHVGWRELAARDALHHPTFHHDCSVELERLEVPIHARDYLTRFLLESVDEVEALSAAALEGGAHLDEFPLMVTAATPPETSQPGIYAAWLHRQSIIRMLREMGVAVDGQFEHVLLNAGLGNTVLPYRWLDPR